TVNSTFEIIDDTINSPFGGLSGLSPVLVRIYDAIISNPEITHKLLAELLHISESTAKRATRELKRLGYIMREGSDKSGLWKILK
ncbi:MAG: winged helix-turn-helix transcriptional regulator, partial [Muribaculaceae bacterium]|nr:winged helix-turn-helix transcriptional regulator [Muribaculaceae bacterium]